MKVVHLGGTRVEAVSEIQLFRAIEDDTKWINAHQEELQDKYVNKFIAVKKGEVIASNKHFDIVLKELKDKGIPAYEIVIRFIFEKGYLFIL